MNRRVEGEPKIMDVHADFVFAFESRTISEKLSPLVEIEQETKLSASSSAEHTSEIVGQMLQLQKAENVLGSCCYEIWFPAKYWIMERSQVWRNANISDLSNVNKTLVRWSVDNRQIVSGQT